MVRPLDRDTAFGEVRGDWTQLGGNGAKGFAFEPPPEQTSCASPRAMTGADYRPARDGRTSQQTFTENLPSGRVVRGTYNRRMPLLTWKAIPGACGYWVVVARDADFTQVVDLALTPEPAYAPRNAFGPVTYPEETTTYYWAVLPSQFADGRGVTSRVQDNAPQIFRKQSLPPRLLGPAAGADVPTQPTFSWTVPRDEQGRPEEVRYYRLQVDDDPTFGSPIDDVVTDSTAYTSTSTYPADTRLYWRVRANDDNVDDRQRGLTWSYPESSGLPRSFTRRLPRPSLSPDNPTSGQGIPLIKWSPVPGAVSYDMHVEQANGTKLDFTFRSTAFTPIAFYGTGVWRWQVRANFKGVFRTVSSGYTPLAPFARRIDTPGSLRTATGGGRAVLTWAPTGNARQYRVQISTSDSFTNVIEAATTENANYAPRMGAPAWKTGQALYWRVAAVDEGFNVGGWASGRLRQSKPMRVRARGVVRLNRTRRVRIRVTDARRRPIRAALVRIGGAGFGTARRTSRKGRVVLKVRGLKKGRVRFRAEKSGYLPTTATLRVRRGARTRRSST
jgi:hypothetical protein